MQIFTDIPLVSALCERLKIRLNKRTYTRENIVVAPSTLSKSQVSLIREKTLILSNIECYSIGISNEVKQI